MGGEVYRKRVKDDGDKVRCRYRKGKLGVTNPKASETSKVEAVGKDERLGCRTQPNPSYHTDSKELATTKNFTLAFGHFWILNLSLSCLP